VVGGICLLLAFYALGTLPVNYAALGLMVLGLAFLAMEPFVVSHGVLSVGGVIAFAVGSLLLINAPDSAPFLEIAPAAIVGVSAVLLGFFVIVAGAVVRSQRRRATTGREAMVAATGEVRSAIPPHGEGMVRVRGELWRATAGERLIAVGEQVIVEAIDGLTLHVRPVASVAPASPTPAGVKAQSGRAPA
jgi:membrane-bound serine protease (ClpP class)